VSRSVHPYFFDSAVNTELQMPVMALGRVKEKQKDYMRSLVKAA